MMKMRVLVPLFLTAILTAAARGGGQKVCKLVCTTKTIQVTCYGCQCEDLCIPGPSKRCKKHCEGVDQCNLLCRLRWTEWRPGCAQVRQVKRLAKYVVARQVPSYKWVVVEYGGGCQGAPGCVLKPAPQGANPGDQLPVSAEELAALAKTCRATTIPESPIEADPAQSRTLAAKLLWYFNK